MFLNPCSDDAVDHIRGLWCHAVLENLAFLDGRALETDTVADYVTGIACNVSEPLTEPESVQAGYMTQAAG